MPIKKAEGLRRRGQREIFLLVYPMMRSSRRQLSAIWGRINEEANRRVRRGHLAEDCCMEVVVDLVGAKLGSRVGGSETATERPNVASRRQAITLSLITTSCVSSGNTTLPRALVSRSDFNEGVLCLVVCASSLRRGKLSFTTNTWHLVVDDDQRGWSRARTMREILACN